MTCLLWWLASNRRNIIYIFSFLLCDPYESLRMDIHSRLHQSPMSHWVNNDLFCVMIHWVNNDICVKSWVLIAPVPSCCSCWWPFAESFIYTKWSRFLQWIHSIHLVVVSSSSHHIYFIIIAIILVELLSSYTVYLVRVYSVVLFAS